MRWPSFFNQKGDLPLELVRGVLQPLPVDLTAETQKLIGISLEGSVGRQEFSWPGLSRLL